MKRKPSVWRRTPVKKHKAVAVKPLQPGDKKPKLSSEAMLKNCISQTSQLSMHVQQLLDECFALAPNQLRGYLLRADVEVRDLLRLLTSKIGSTPDPDILPVDYFKEDLENVDEKHAGSVNTAVSNVSGDDDMFLVQRSKSKHAKSTNRHNAAATIALSTSALLEELAESAGTGSTASTDFESEIKTLTKVSRRYACTDSDGNNEE